MVDRRMLEFHGPALRMALEAAGARLYGLPWLPVTDMGLLPQEDAVRFRLGTGETAADHVIAGPRLGAMLIGYCIGAGVPLPNLAAKTMRVHDSFVELGFTIGYANAPGASCSPPERRPEVTAGRRPR